MHFTFNDWNCLVLTQILQTLEIYWSQFPSIETQTEWNEKYRLHRMPVEYRSMPSCIHIVKSHFVCNHDIDNVLNPNPSMYKMLHSIQHSVRLCVDNFAVLQRPNFVWQCVDAAKSKIYCRHREMFSVDRWTIALIQFVLYNNRLAWENVLAAQNDGIPIQRVHCLYSKVMRKILHARKRHN